MIKSDILKIKKINDFDNEYIEGELNKNYDEIIRWAIVDIDNEYLYISVSFECKS